jgi:hypothetical protein
LTMVYLASRSRTPFVQNGWLWVNLYLTYYIQNS